MFGEWMVLGSLALSVGVMVFGHWREWRVLVRGLAGLAPEALEEIQACFDLDPLGRWCVRPTSRRWGARCGCFV